MACTHYPEDPERAHLDALVVFDVEQTAAYAHEDELYGPYREGMGEATEAVARLVVALEGKRASLEELRRRRAVREGRRPRDSE
jgi:phosphoserine phosphatase